MPPETGIFWHKSDYVKVIIRFDNSIVKGADFEEGGAVCKKSQFSWAFFLIHNQTNEIYVCS